MTKTKPLTSKQRKQKMMRDRVANAPAPLPKRGTPEWKKARNVRRRVRARVEKRLRQLNQSRATSD